MTSPAKILNLVAGLSILLLAEGFLLTPSANQRTKSSSASWTANKRITSLANYPPLCRLCASTTDKTQEKDSLNKNVTTTRNALASVALVTALTFTPLLPNTPAYAYDGSDFASDAVETVVKSLKDADGNPDQTFQAYENIADIITEGKGVGGVVNYKGVTLERGYIADEDTSIYNPGLTLLTEGEKNRLVDAIMKSRQAGLEKNEWSEKNQLAYEYLKVKLDPLHMTELKGYLGVVPALVGAAYLAVMAVQQNARGLFPIAYFGAVVAILAPAVLLIATGQ